VSKVSQMFFRLVKLAPLFTWPLYEQLPDWIFQLASLMDSSGGETLSAHGFRIE